MQVLAIIMADGSGTRLWPLLRELFPMQFLALDEQASMLQVTVSRLNGLPVSSPLVICNESHRFLVAVQLRLIGALSGNIMLEPAGRNTTLTVNIAALQATSHGSDALLLVSAADLMIQDTAAFQAAVQKAMPLAQAGSLVTFGIVANRPETGYGYIKRGAALSNGVFKVAAFVEKPAQSVAEQYVASGDYDWNSGMFLFRASRYLSELQLHRPDILANAKKPWRHRRPTCIFLCG